MIRRLSIFLVAAMLILGWLMPTVAEAAPPPHHQKHRNCPPPSAPSQVSASSGTNRAIVTWQPASGNGSQITAYIVTAYSGSSPSTAVATDGNTLAASLFGLAGGTTYTVQVYAQSSCGSGPAASSNPVTPTGSATTYETTVQADGPVAYYRLSELNGTVAADSSGNGALGAYGSGVGLGVPGAIVGNPDTAASWNGASCCLLTSAPTLPLGNAPRTIEAWIQTTSTNEIYVAGYGQVGTSQVFNVAITPTQVILVTYNNDRSWNTHILNDGKWHYIVVTYDGQNATAYVDGQSLGSQSYTGGINTLSSGLTVGCANGGNFACFDGALDEVAVYSKALTAAQVAAHFALSGYSRPSAPAFVAASYGGEPNTVIVSWGIANSNGSPLIGYVITAYQGKAAKNATATSGNGTAVKISGLPGGVKLTFQVYAINAYGDGPSRISKAVTPGGSNTTYATTVQTDGPVAYYRLGEPSGTRAADSSGNGVLGIYGNGVGLRVPGAIVGDPDTAASWNGACCGLLTSSPALPLGNAPRTVEAWVQTTSTSEIYVAGYGQVGDSQVFNVAITPTQVILITFANDRSWNTHVLNDGRWHYIVVTYDGQNATAYVDGQSLGSQSYSGGINTLSSGLTVGCANGGAFACFDGALDEVAVYSKSLTAAQVAAHFALSGYSRPNAPTNVQATAGNNSATVTWSPSTSGTQPITGYVVTAYAGTSAKTAVATGGSGTSATVYGLAGGTVYTFQVYAINAYGEGQIATSKAVTPGGSSTTYATTVETDGPVAYYRLSELTGTTAADSSGNGVLGIYGNGVGLGVPGAITGDPDTAASWNGTCCGILTSSPTLPLGNAPRSIEAWIQTTSTGFNYIAGYGQFGDSQSFSIGIAPTYVSLVTWYNDRSWNTHTLNDGKWHYIVVTYDGQNATAYVDGQSLGSQSYTGGINTLPSGLTVGCDFGADQGCMTGALDEVAVYSTVLTAAQVTAHYQAAGY